MGTDELPLRDLVDELILQGCIQFWNSVAYYIYWGVKTNTSHITV